MPETSSVEIRLLAQQGNTYPVEMTLTATQQVFRGQVSADLTVWTPSGDSRADGQALFSALFASADLMRGWGVAHGKSKQLRVQLRIDAPELHALPWELLRDDQDLLAADADSPFSRYLAVSREWGQPIANRPIRVLAVISNPQDIDAKYGLPPADVELETQVLKEALASSLSQSEGAAVTFFKEPVTLDRLEAELRNGYHILHFVGHGAFSTKSQQAALYLQDHAGNAQRVIDDEFAGMLNRSASPPHLVVLAACQSAQQSMKAAFSGLGPKLVQIGVPAVIAMQENVTVLSARQFAATFYQRLLAHGTVDLAMNEARGTLITNGRFDAAVPVLFMRLPDGRLWNEATLHTTHKEDRAMTEESGKKQSGKTNINIDGDLNVDGDFVAGNRVNLTGGNRSNTIIQRNGGQVIDNSKNQTAQNISNVDGGINFGRAAKVVIKGDVLSGDKTITKAGGDIVTGDKITTVNKGLSGEEIAALFNSIYLRIDANRDLPPRDKEDLKSDVKDVESETAKVAQGQKPDESFLERRLRSIKRMAPDILDVIASTFASPSLGAAAVIRKVVDRVKQEAA